jgi:hypothetical protein
LPTMLIDPNLKSASLANTLQAPDHTHAKTC